MFTRWFSPVLRVFRVPEASEDSSGLTNKTDSLPSGFTPNASGFITALLTVYESDVFNCLIFSRLSAYENVLKNSTYIEAKQKVCFNEV